MKKIYAILLALCALGIFVAGCSKPADSTDTKTPDAGKTDTPKSGS